MGGSYAIDPDTGRIRSEKRFDSPEKAQEAHERMESGGSLTGGGGGSGGGSRSRGGKRKMDEVVFKDPLGRKITVRGTKGTKAFNKQIQQAKSKPGYVKQDPSATKEYVKRHRGGSGSTRHKAEVLEQAKKQRAVHWPETIDILIKKCDMND